MDGGTVDGVTISNVVMRNVVALLFVRLGNRGRDQEQPTPGRLCNVVISGVMAVGATGTGSIAGPPETHRHEAHCSQRQPTSHSVYLPKTSSSEMNGSVFSTSVNS
jgi:hypothetical protein